MSPLAALRLAALAAWAGLAACGPASNPGSSLEGPMGGTPCGYRYCPSGQYCCNDSCGICAPVGGSCTQQVCTGDGRRTCERVQICPAGTAWDEGVCRCVDAVPDRGACQTDADCRLVSVYCDGCECHAVGAAEPDPVCRGQETQCLVDPCAKRKALCLGGVCGTAPAP